METKTKPLKPPGVGYIKKSNNLPVLYFPKLGVLNTTHFQICFMPRIFVCLLSRVSLATSVWRRAEGIIPSWKQNSTWLAKALQHWDQTSALLGSLLFPPEVLGRAGSPSGGLFLRDPASPVLGVCYRCHTQRSPCRLLLLAPQVHPDGQWC